MAEIMPPSKKVKVSLSTPEPFTTKSDPDDIDLKFDDGMTLYVHPAFLSLMSPVFKAMFKHEFKEKNTKKPRLPGKKSEDFLEFLMCLHPAHLKPVDNTNVLRIVGIAHEYQVPSILSRCETVMMSMLAESITYISGRWSYNDTRYLQKMIVCLDIFNISNTLNITKVKDVAIMNVARFGVELYTQASDDYRSCSEKAKELRIQCDYKFQQIPDNCRYEILFQRLRYIDDNNFYGKT